MISFNFPSTSHFLMELGLMGFKLGLFKGLCREGVKFNIVYPPDLLNIVMIIFWASFG